MSDFKDVISSTEVKQILEDIKQIVSKTRYFLEGNCFYTHHTFNPHPSLIDKQENLYNSGKGKMKICEIGFNAGHSTLLFLLANKDNNENLIEYTIFDIGRQPYTNPCLEYILTKFTNVRFQYVEGNSILSMPYFLTHFPDKKGTYDLIHVDGGHSAECIISDLQHADLLIKKGGTIIIDDTDVEHINAEVDKYLANKHYEEIFLKKTEIYPHRIIKRLP